MAITNTGSIPAWISSKIIRVFFTHNFHHDHNLNDHHLHGSHCYFPFAWNVEVFLYPFYEANLISEYNKNVAVASMLWFYCVLLWDNNQSICPATRQRPYIMVLCWSTTRPHLNQDQRGGKEYRSKYRWRNNKHTKKHERKYIVVFCCNTPQTQVQNVLEAPGRATLF